ncbi:J domain-containing protein [Luteibacter yeojuensis]|uniref:J domain-containing protein n=1 Tax=Luteibacter yeojuensis TaxID=345309 RepID=A0A7X5QSD4_9GAMM|nr:J domain-containing protein [Luteibacter yeojuensis]NID14542.1 J domain-containing protein [Luteibacter yeojuensis]
MADETDFMDLYGKLRLEPGCSLEDFKRAYRRNVAMWHPDRRRGSRADQLAAARLQRLTAQYGAAMDFHRRHGRLPGAPLPVRRTEGALTEPGIAEALEPAIPAPKPAAASPIRAGYTGHARRWWLVAMAAGAAILAWSSWPADPAPEAEARPVSAPSMERETPPAPVLALGMTPEDVVAVEGEPTRRGEERWEYGPSWIRFEQGEVVDWYSSPLRVLHVGATRPGR